MPADCERNRVNCIAPPYLVDAMRMRGDERVQKLLDTLERETDQARVERQNLAPPDAFQAAPQVAAEVAPAPERRVYDGKNKAALKGDLVRSEGDEKVDDDAVDEAYDGAGHTYDLYFQEYRRDSLDGAGLTLDQTVHHRRNFLNAFWNGEQMVYGDGDGQIFTRFTASLSVIAHELSHGVVQFSGGLVYRDQSGALNESFADVMGALTVQRANGLTAAQADWLIGDGILAPDIQGVALRSMRAPGTAYDDPLLGKDPQPFHMDQYVSTSSDNGGVHINSGIPNHAFYLLSQYLGGNAWEKAGGIWYEALQSLTNPLATFADWADETVATASSLHGSGSTEALFTKRAWQLVGVL